MGQALGFLKTEQNRESPVNEPDIPEPEKKYLELLRNRLKLIDSNGRSTSILAQIPNQRCSLRKPYLMDNEDFFLVFFLSDPEKHCCVQLSRHLNKCLGCFEIFSQVMRDYYHKH